MQRESRMIAEKCYTLKLATEKLWLNHTNPVTSALFGLIQAMIGAV